ncbi:MAG: hypothetical protein Q9174_003712, partial [Haloplaca sp. 1 TL-2023]
MSRRQDSTSADHLHAASKPGAQDSHKDYENTENRIRYMLVVFLCAVMLYLIALSVGVISELISGRSPLTANFDLGVALALSSYLAWAVLLQLLKFGFCALVAFAAQQV